MGIKSCLSNTSLVSLKVVEAMIQPVDGMLIVKKLPFSEITDLPFFLLSYKEDNQILNFQRDFFKVQIDSQLYCNKEET
jgi:hypothetical protein